MQYIIFKQKPWKMWVRNALIFIVLIEAVSGTQKQNDYQPFGDNEKKRCEGQLFYSLREKTADEKKAKHRENYDYYGVNYSKKIHTKIAESEFALDVAYYEKNQLVIISDVISMNIPDDNEKPSIPGMKKYAEKKNGFIDKFDLEVNPKEDEGKTFFLTTVDTTRQKFTAHPYLQSYPLFDFKKKKTEKKLICDMCNDDIKVGKDVFTCQYCVLRQSYDLCKECQEKFENDIEAKFTQKYLTQVQFKRGLIFHTLDTQNKNYDIRDEGEFFQIFAIKEPKKYGKIEEPRNYGRIALYCFIIIFFLASGGYILYQYYYPNFQEEAEKNQTTNKKARYKIKPNDCVIEVAKQAVAFEKVIQSNSDSLLPEN